MNKVLIVTGGSRGIGAATAVAAARKGYAVGVTYVQEAHRAAEVVEQIHREGGRAVALQGNVAIEAQVEHIFRDLDAALGSTYGLVNCAGLTGPAGRVVDCQAGSLLNVMAVNVVGSFLCAREAIKRMSTSRGGQGGVIVNLSSVAARLGAAGSAVHYAASKGAINSFTFGLAQEVASEGIRVVAVSPGVIDTDMQPPGRVAEIGPKLPMARAGRADEVAEAIVWLLGNEASYVSGAVLDVSGAR